MTSKKHADLHIRSARVADRETVVDLLTTVFADDPLMRAIAAPASDPHRALEDLHRKDIVERYLSDDSQVRRGLYVDLAVASPATSDVPGNSSVRGGIQAPGDGEESLREAPHAEHAQSADQILGVMLWEDPTHPPLAEVPPPPPGWDCGERGAVWERLALDIAQCIAHRPTEPHWYAYMLAVAPSAQGRGVGSALMRHGLARVDAVSLPAHLESTTPGSRRLYGRMDFETVAELRAAPLPPYWAMTRPAR